MFFYVQYSSELDKQCLDWPYCRFFYSRYSKKDMTFQLDIRDFKLGVYLFKNCVMVNFCLTIFFFTQKCKGIFRQLCQQQKPGTPSLLSLGQNKAKSRCLAALLAFAVKCQHSAIIVRRTESHKHSSHNLVSYLLLLV